MNTVHIGNGDDLCSAPVETDPPQKEAFTPEAAAVTPASTDTASTEAAATAMDSSTESSTDASDASTDASTDDSSAPSSESSSAELSTESATESSTDSSAPSSESSSIESSSTASTPAPEVFAPSDEPAPEVAAPQGVVVFIDGQSVASVTPNQDGTWSVDVAAPSAIGSHVVTATCNGTPLDQPSESSFNEIIVEPPFDPTADPSQYTVSTTPDSITFTGRFCINSKPFEDIATGSSSFSTLAPGDESTPPIVVGIGLPTVIVDFNGAQMSQVASSNQPFDEVWTLTFPNPPNAPGTYTAHVTCGFDDVPNIADLKSLFSSLSDSDSTFNEGDLIDLFQWSKVKEADVPVEVLPDPTTTTQAPAVEAGAATPVVEQPRFTG